MISGKNYFSSKSKSSFIKILNEIRQFFLVFFKFLKIKPDVIYFDNSNILIASIFSRFLKVKVILRVMGVYPFMKNVKKKDTLIKRIYYFAYSTNLQQLFVVKMEVE